MAGRLIPIFPDMSGKRNQQKEQNDECRHLFDPSEEDLLTIYSTILALGLINLQSRTQSRWASIRRRAAFRLHPDKSNNPTVATELFKVFQYSCRYLDDLTQAQYEEFIERHRHCRPIPLLDIINFADIPGPSTSAPQDPAMSDAIQELQREVESLRAQNEALTAEASSSTAARHQAEEEAKRLLRQNKQLRKRNEELSAEASSSAAARNQAEEEAQALTDTLNEARRTRRILAEDNERHYRAIQALREASRNQQLAAAEVGAQLTEEINQLSALLQNEEERHRRSLTRLDEAETLAASLRHNLEQEMRRPHKARRQPCPYCNSADHNPLDCTVVVDRSVRRRLIGDRCVNCLGRHDVIRCPSRKTCLHCKQWHHTSLCALGTPHDVPGPSTSRAHEDQCPICLTGDDRPVTRTYCGHLFHQICLDEWITSQLNQHQNPTCPNCRAPLHIDSRHRQPDTSPEEPEEPTF
ncbi:unnamed protein product [Bursaphelenchus xylophilus]|uniref:(pine wood nematode) hypothetical protein n=1 Tax=Bursaphelenchus xylophilus TaxID=6326 RepID=A0A7I8XHD3_BURXY|nr:unnamed protein product [Bursaphelenchus xylophilus]CAG9079132.1 unnamed protein product [Bursaphelenchus xylophilus]